MIALYCQFPLCKRLIAKTRSDDPPKVLFFIVPRGGIDVWPACCLDSLTAAKRVMEMIGCQIIRCDDESVIQRGAPAARPVFGTGNDPLA